MVTPDAILHRINKLNRVKPRGRMKSHRVIYELGRELSVPLSILFNKSLELGKISLEWKNANVVAIFKNGTKSKPGNYRPVSLTVLLHRINKLNRVKPRGRMKSHRVIYELGRELSVPLSILFNKSLELGKISLEWKNANVVAIFKNGTKSKPGNYRPVSLTCVTCKILESVIRDAIVEHMNDSNLYSDCQHGFRKRRSCVTQLLQVMEDLSLLVENGGDIECNLL